MATYTRKEFLGLSAVLAGGAGLARLPVAAAQEPAGTAGPADLAVINARVYTVDDALPRAQAFAVRGTGSPPWAAPTTCGTWSIRARR